MERPETEPLHTFLTTHIYTAGDADSVAYATVSAWEAIERALQPVVGKGGMDALFRRTLHLAADQHNWLTPGGPQSELLHADAGAFHTVMAGQATAEAQAGAASFLRHFDALLSGLLGPALTGRLLRPVWAGTFRALNQQDIRQ